MTFHGSPYEMQTEMSRGPLVEGEAQHPPTQPKRKKEVFMGAWVHGCMGAWVPILLPE